MNKKKSKRLHTNRNQNVSFHAKKRFVERTELEEEEERKMSDLSEQAFKFGRKLRVFYGSFYWYLCSRTRDSANCSLRVYEDKVFIFDNRCGKLITIYPVPDEYLPVSNWIIDGSNVQKCIVLVEFVEDDGTKRTEYFSNEDGRNGLVEDIALATEFRTLQRAENFVKNNRMFGILKDRGARIVLLPL